MNITTIFKKNFFGWKKYNFQNYEIWFSGYIYESHKHELVSLIVKSINENNIKIKKLLSIKKKYNGHYSLLIKKNSFLLLLNDAIGSVPIFYTLKKKKILISNCASLLLKKIRNKQAIEDQCNFLLNSGYTIGCESILKDFFCLAPNKVIIFANNKLIQHISLPAFCNKKNNLNKSKLFKELEQITFSVFRDLIKSANGRQLVIPLSAGYDSRLILSFIRNLNYKNIICYSYGMSGNSETEIAKKICRKLKIKFIFDELLIREQRQFYESSFFKKFLDDSDNKNSIPIFQGLSTLYRLKKNKLIDKNAIILNGNTGDFISGGHLSGFIKENKINRISVNEYIYKKHFSQWDTKNLMFKNLIMSRMNIERHKYNIYFKKKITDYEFFEIFEYLNRQAKYVSSNRVNEFCGYEWRMPLWDSRFVNFWLKVNPKYKIDQNLYKSFLKKLNLGDIWGPNFPINQKKVYPVSIRILRNLLKLFFVFFGKDSWHKFDKIYLYYFYDVTRMMSSFKYLDYIKNKKLGKNSFHTSLQSFKYLEKIKLNNLKLEKLLYA